MWDDADKRRIYVEGLGIRAVSASAFGAMFLIGAAWEWHKIIEGYWPVQMILAGLVAVNPVLWLVGRSRGFPMRDLYMHWLIDVVAVAGIVYFLGVFEVPLSPIAFMIMIVSSAAYMTMSAAFYLAVASSCVWIVLWLSVSGESRPGPSPLGISVDAAGEWFLGVATIVFFFVFAYVAGMVADKLRRKTMAVIEQRREMERVLQREQTVRDESETLSAIVQHDVYGPLAAIKGIALELEGELMDGRAAECAGLLKRLHLQISSIDAAVESLGLFGGESRSEPIAIADVVARVVRDLNALIFERCVSVTVENVAFVVAVDERRCYHVVRNLVANAVKCVPDDGRGLLRIYATNVEAPLRLVIEDNGPGLSAKFVDALTRKGAVVPTKGRDGEGLGIGLYLTRRLVHSWGGAMEYASVESGGAAVAVTFPEAARVGNDAT
jgi:signal transduction histidine kinase